MDALFWKIAFGLYLAALPAAMVHVVATLARSESGLARRSRGLVALRLGVNLVLLAGFLALGASVVARWHLRGYPPFTNLPESLAWMGLGFAAVYFVARLVRGFVGMELAGALGVLAILAASEFLSKEARPLMPALQSNWLVFHVLTCMVSYGAFFAAFLMGVLWLAIWHGREAARVVESLTYHTITFGFLLLTVGIATGAIWANQAWGRYWGWDPKETWSLITWLVYGMYLHVRLAPGMFRLKRERMPLLTALLAILGFAFVMFTYVGVTYLLPGLHSYAT